MIVANLERLERRIKRSPAARIGVDRDELVDMIRQIRIAYAFADEFEALTARAAEKHMMPGNAEAGRVVAQKLRDRLAGRPHP